IDGTVERKRNFSPGRNCDLLQSGRMLVLNACCRPISSSDSFRAFCIGILGLSILCNAADNHCNNEESQASHESTSLRADCSALLERSHLLILACSISEIIARAA